MADQRKRSLDADNASGRPLKKKRFNADVDFTMVSIAVVSIAVEPAHGASHQFGCPLYKLYEIGLRDDSEFISALCNQKRREWTIPLVETDAVCITRTLEQYFSGETAFHELCEEEEGNTNGRVSYDLNTEKLTELEELLRIAFLYGLAALARECVDWYTSIIHNVLLGGERWDLPAEKCFRSVCGILELYYETNAEMMGSLYVSYGNMCMYRMHTWWTRDPSDCFVETCIVRYIMTSNLNFRERDVLILRALKKGMTGTDINLSHLLYHISPQDITSSLVSRIPRWDVPSSIMKEGIYLSLLENKCKTETLDCMVEVRSLYSSTLTMGTKHKQNCKHSAEMDCSFSRRKYMVCADCGCTSGAEARSSYSFHNGTVKNGWSHYHGEHEPTIEMGIMDTKGAMGLFVSKTRDGKHYCIYTSQSSTSDLLNEENVKPGNYSLATRFNTSFVFEPTMFAIPLVLDNGAVVVELNVLTNNYRPCKDAHTQIITFGGNDTCWLVDLETDNLMRGAPKVLAPCMLADSILQPTIVFTRISSERLVVGMRYSHDFSVVCVATLNYKEFKNNPENTDIVLGKQWLCVKQNLLGGYVQSNVMVLAMDLPEENGFRLYVVDLLSLSVTRRIRQRPVVFDHLYYNAEKGRICAVAKNMDEPKELKIVEVSLCKPIGL